MYHVIAIQNGKYEHVTTDAVKMADARTLKETFEESLEPLIIEDLKVELAIEVNNKRKGFE